MLITAESVIVMVGLHVDTLMSAGGWAIFLVFVSTCLVIGVCVHIYLNLTFFPGEDQPTNGSTKSSRYTLSSRKP